MENIYNKRRNHEILDIYPVSRNKPSKNSLISTEQVILASCAKGKKGKPVELSWPQEYENFKMPKVFAEFWRPSLSTEAKMGRNFIGANLWVSAKRIMQYWLCNVGEYSHDRWC